MHALIPYNFIMHFSIIDAFVSCKHWKCFICNKLILIWPPLTSHHQQLQMNWTDQITGQGIAFWAVYGVGIRVKEEKGQEMGFGQIWVLDKIMWGIQDFYVKCDGETGLGGGGAGR